MDEAIPLRMSPMESFHTFDYFWSDCSPHRYSFGSREVVLSTRRIRKYLSHKYMLKRWGFKGSLRMRMGNQSMEGILLPCRCKYISGHTSLLQPPSASSCLSGHSSVRNGTQIGPPFIQQKKACLPRRRGVHFKRAFFFLNVRL